MTQVERPGYFGRRRDERICELNQRFGAGSWMLMWEAGGSLFDFFNACRYLYEESYFQYFKDRPAEIDFVCSFHECYDNALTNVASGLDYMKQEAYSTHIQDIALRNVLRRLGRWFTLNKTSELSAFLPGVLPGTASHLQIRSKDSAGYRFGPGNIPFAWPQIITQPSLAPSWAKQKSVEDFWQSNKWVVTA